MANNSDYKKRIESEARAAMPIRNKDLICKECIFRFDDSEIFGNTSRCEIYDSKPSNIITGGICKFYTKKR